jgi:hypothetical protein
MTVIAFDVVYGFFDLYHVFTYYWIDSIADFNLARSTRIKCPHLRLFEKKFGLRQFFAKMATGSKNTGHRKFQQV